jgi:hypothetical protein
MDITRDVMRLTGEGKTPAQIRTLIDAKYVPQGRPMDTPRPPR